MNRELKACAMGKSRGTRQWEDDGSFAAADSSYGQFIHKR